MESAVDKEGPYMGNCIIFSLQNTHPSTKFGPICAEYLLQFKDVLPLLKVRHQRTLQLCLGVTASDQVFKQLSWEIFSIVWSVTWKE
jgi:hypothetical protein